MYHFICSGLDYNTASIAVRELFSLTKSKQAELYAFLRVQEGVRGAVLISTCNRMELCLSLDEGVAADPFSLVCAFLQVDVAHYHDMVTTYCDKEVITHLCLLACGAKSQIFGEDQIITQIKTSIHYARELEMADSLLEVLFRTAITCAKKIKSTLSLAVRETSIADCVVDALAVQSDVQRVMVIGNGEMGRYVAAQLAAAGYQVCMSVRAYKHKKVDVPQGVAPFDYAEIYQRMAGVDAVVSATLSPHFTVRKENFVALAQYPRYLFDLAVPRDIDPEIASVTQVQMQDVDTLSKGARSERNQALLAEMDEICARYRADFDKWYAFKQKVVIYED